MRRVCLHGAGGVVLVGIRGNAWRSHGCWPNTRWTCCWQAKSDHISWSKLFVKFLIGSALETADACCKMTCRSSSAATQDHDRVRPMSAQCSGAADLARRNHDSGLRRVGLPAPWETRGCGCMAQEDELPGPIERRSRLWLAATQRRRQRLRARFVCCLTIHGLGRPANFDGGANCSASCWAGERR